MEQRKNDTDGSYLKHAELYNIYDRILIKSEKFHNFIFFQFWTLP